MEAIQSHKDKSQRLKEHAHYLIYNTTSKLLQWTKLMCINMNLRNASI